jgi:carbamoyltransferase
MNGIESPYMILVFDIKEEWKNKINSVVHENNTSRVQTVNPDWNEKYYNLLLEFKKITGISVLLNTSFNRKGMPIVETPKDAIDLFLECSLDYLIIEDFIISK